MLLPTRASLILLAAAVTACSGGNRPLYIGAAGPWTESFGRMNQLGIQLAIEEINARGGVRGRPLRVIERDDEGVGSTAAAIASEFVANRAIVGVVGHVTSGAMMAAARIYDQGLPAIATTASSPDLSGISDWAFRVISSDSANGLTMAQFAETRGYARAAILYENNSYGRGLADAFERRFTGTIVSKDPIPSDGRTSVEPWLSWLATRAPDLVFVAGTDASGRAVLQEARRQGLRTAFMGGDGWTPLANDTIAAEGAWVGAPFSAEDPRSEAQRFVRAFVDRHGETPDGNAALAYDATMVLAAAIEQAGASRSRVRDWLANLQTGDPHGGVTGPIAFNIGGDVIGRGVVMTRIRKGALTVEGGGAGS
jgi:branched-chain amino acid transport system substrate-binding protein